MGEMSLKEEEEEKRKTNWDQVLPLMVLVSVYRGGTGKSSSPYINEIKWQVKLSVNNCLNWSLVHLMQMTT